MEYITIDKATNTISSYSTGDTLPENAIEIKGFAGKVGDSISLYDADYHYKSDLQLYIEGLKEIPKGFKLNSDKTAIVALTDIEKMQLGIIQIPFGQKIVDGKLVAKTIDEEFSDGTIDKEQYYGLKISDLRAKLEDTDYISIKIAEGAATKEEYASKLTDRAEWRKQISELQDEIETLHTK